MYKANQRHLQPLLISNVSHLPERLQKRLKGSWAEDFYRDFFSRLNEDAFAVLYVDHPSRPNVPVNWLVALEALKAGFGWSDEELYDHFCFDLQVRYALGLHDLQEGEFDLRTLYYFRERLSQYNLLHGVNLLVQAFESITDQQLSILKVKTGQQRMDSTHIASNIMDMSRLQLLVEALQRLYRRLSEADQERYGETCAPYVQGHSGQYVYRIKGRVATDEHLQQIGQVIQYFLEELASAYRDEPAYQVLQRFFADNYRLEEQSVQVKTNQELESGCLQSCDDLEASYRRKGQREYKGYVANLSETCDPDNEVQLITKVQAAANNVNDTDLIVEALPNLKARTGLDTLYTDGAFAGPTVDPVLRAQGVEQIQSGIHGVVPNPHQLNLADFEIQQNEAGVPQQITCLGGQTVPVEPSSQKRGYRADFDPQVCQACPLHLQEHCPTCPGKKRSTFRLTFLPSELNVAQRRRKLRLNQQIGKNPRAAIEGTVREVKHPFPASKLPVRGLFRVTCLLVGSAAMTNVRRIHHYWEEKRKDELKKEADAKGPQAAQASQDQFFVALAQAWWSAWSVFLVSFKPCFGC